MNRDFQEIQVIFDSGRRREEVGLLAVSGSTTLFEYAPSWQGKGIELAPFHLPVSRRSFRFDSAKLVGSVPGLCADSLPDGWGMLIMDRIFMGRGVRRHNISALDRLAYLGDHAMGALCYHPSSDDDRCIEAVDLGATAQEAYRLYEGKIEEASGLLARIGGSPGGARPKALIGISADGASFVSGQALLPAGFSHWLVKFSGPKASHLRPLGPYEGILEYLYLQAAREAGIQVPEFRLITDDHGLRHIAVRRFDRPAGEERLHVATAFGLLHADYQLPSLDYQELLRVAWSLTRDISQVREQFRRAAFNLLAVNRDDHAKNHGYLMAPDGSWRLSPAYDLTFSEGPGGEHWTSFLGEGRHPTSSALRELAELSSIPAREAEAIIAQVAEALERFPALCREWKVPLRHVRPIMERMREVRI